MDLVAVLIGVAVLGLASWGVYIGITALRRWRQLGADDPVSIRNAITHSGSGSVEIEGTVRPEETTLESPHFGRECVAYEYKTEERRRRSGSSGSRSSWRTIDSGEAAHPFFIDDDSGRAYVDPSGATLSLESERSRKTNEQGDPIPDDSTWNVTVSGNIPGMGGMGINNRRYTEKRLDVGRHCYAVGTAERPLAGIDADVMISGTDAPTFLISDATEAETRKRLLVRGAGYTVGGLAGLGIGVWILLGQLL